MLFCFVSPAFAEIKPPEWSEFCPDKYLNAEYQKVSKWDYWFNFKKEENNYWALRKMSFEKQLKYCDSEPSCYLLISQNEENKNRQDKQATENNNINMLLLNGIWNRY
jgi:hypothetical protein